MTFPQIYLVVSVILLGFTTFIWDKSNLPNVSIKMIFGIATVMGIYVICSSRIFG
jgi:hypothetical protein